MYNFYEMFQSFIYYFLTVGGISTLAYFIFKTAISKSFDFAIEKYKSGLNKDLESHRQKLLLETEKFKGDLNIITIEHNIAFSKLQEERAIVIKETYIKLIDLQNKLFNLTTMLQGPDWHNDVARDDAAKKSLNDFREYVSVNRIFLTKGVCTNIIKIINQSWDVIVDMSLTKEEAKLKYNVGGSTPVQQWRELNKKVTNDIEQAAIELEDNFRKLLGDK